MILNDAENIMIGNTEVLKVYAGDNEVWTRSGVQEKTGVSPLTFRANGTNLIDWSITGAAGGVGNLGINKLNYKSIAQGEGPGGTYTDGGTIAGVAMNTVSIPNETPPTANYQRWYMLRANINEGGNWVDDYRSPTYANCNWYAKLTAGTYKLIAECANPYGKTVRVPNLDSIYRNDSVLPGNHIPRYDLVDSSGNILIEVTWQDFFVSENQQKWTRKETTFTITEETDVGVFSKMFQYDSSYAVDNITPYLVFRYMIVPVNTPTKQFSVTVDGNTITGETCWEPYRFIIPVVVSSGDQTTTIDIYIDEALGANDTLTMAAAGVALPTYTGVTTIDINTDITPSELYIKYSI